MVPQTFHQFARHARRSVAAAWASPGGGAPLLGAWLVALLAPAMMPLAAVTIDPNGDALVRHGFPPIPFMQAAPYQLVALLTALLLTARLLAGRDSRRRSPLDAPFLAWVGAVGLSVVASDFPRESLRQLLKLTLALWPCAWVAVQTLRTRQHIQVALAAFLVGSAANAAVGVAQFCLREGLRYRLYAWQTRLPNGLTAESSLYAISMSLALAVAVPAACSSERGALRSLARALLPLFVAGLVLAANRSAWLAVAVVLLVVVLGVPPAGRRRALRLAGAVVALALAGFLAVSVLAPRPVTRLGRKLAWGDYSSRVRATEARLAWETWRNPIWGNGVGTYFPHLAARGAVPERVRAARSGSLFNVFAGILYDTGLLGLLAIGWLLWRYLQAWRASRPWPGDDGGHVLWLAALALALALLVNAQFHGIWQHGTCYFLIALGLVAAGAVRDADATDAPGRVIYCVSPAPEAPDQLP